MYIRMEGTLKDGTGSSKATICDIGEILTECEVRFLPVGPVDVICPPSLPQTAYTCHWGDPVSYRLYMTAHEGIRCRNSPMTRASAIWLTTEEAENKVELEGSSIATAGLESMDCTHAFSLFEKVFDVQAWKLSESRFSRRRWGLSWVGLFRFVCMMLGLSHLTYVAEAFNAFETDRTTIYKSKQRMYSDKSDAGSGNSVDATDIHVPPQLPQVNVRRFGRDTGRSTFVSLPRQQQAHSIVVGSFISEKKVSEPVHPVTSFWADIGASVFGVEAGDMSLSERTTGPSSAIVTHHYEQYVRGIRVVAGSVNVQEGAHKGVLSALGHPLRTTDVAEINEMPSVNAQRALAKAMHYLQTKFGVVYRTQVKDVEVVWVRPGLAKDGTGEAPKLAYQLTTITTIDGGLFSECFAAEGGNGDSIFKPSDTEKLTMDKYGVKYPKTDAEVHAKRVTCTKRILQLSHAPSHFFKAVENAGLTKHNTGVIHVPERSVIRRFISTKAPTTRRVTVYVDAHTGAVLTHDDKDINKFTGFNGKKLAKRAPKEHLDLVALKQDKVITATVKDNKFGNLNGWELGMSPLKTFWGANVEMIKPKHHKQMVGKNAIDFVDFHVVIYDCEGDEECDPEEFTTVLFDSDVDAFPTNDDEINLVIQSTYDTKVMYEVISGGTWKSYKKEVAEWLIYLHLDQLNAFWDGTRTVFGTGMVDDDVVAHEWSHAYTEYSSGYAYY